MSEPDRIRVFFTAPDIDPQATGESFGAFRWAEAMSHEVDLTVFAYQRANRPPLQESLPDARVLTVPRPTFFQRWPRFEAMVKPHYPIYMRAVRKALRQHPGEFDLAHQLMPPAARYPIALRGAGLPYVVGPLAGTLETPAAFREEGQNAAWFIRARALDRWRFRNDPWLRAGYAEADLVLGVAPYMREMLSVIPLRRFELLMQLGVVDLAPEIERQPRTGDVRLLHIGRGVRTKGLRDTIRAMGQLRDVLPDMTLTSAGTGEEIEICRREAETLGIADRVRFVGLIPRAEVETLYAEADIFVFPSYREPAGNVVYEAMRWGLPVIAADCGGPASMVDERTGIQVAVTKPGLYADDIAAAIRALAGDPARRRAMGAAARTKLEREAFWPAKAKILAGLYAEVLEGRRAAKETR